MEEIIIRNTQSPGDLIVLTAAIRELHRAHPGRFKFGLDVSERNVFKHNPHINLLQEEGRVVVAKYPAIHNSNQRRIHFLWSFIEYLNRELSAQARLTDFRPDLHLSPEEREIPPLGAGRKYWVIASGGKMDFTAKWWQPSRWQSVVDALSDRFEFVQVGGTGDKKHPHIHPPLKGVINLIGKTSFRELARLIYHSEGVLCVVTCLMHIAAAFNKPCVTVAGGREAWWWEGYTHESRLLSMRHAQPNWMPPDNDGFVAHHYLHTMNQLPCCMDKGCWKNHVEECPLPMQVPVPDMTKRLPKCMDIILPEHVVAAVNSYYLPQGPRVIPFPDSPVVSIPIITESIKAPRNSFRKITLAVQCRNESATACAQLYAALSNVADLCFVALQPNNEIEMFCAKNSLSFSYGPDFGTQLKRILARATTPYFATMPAGWTTTEKGMLQLMEQLAGAPTTVKTLVYKKCVDETFQNRLDPQHCIKPLLKNQRSGQGYLVFYPGNRILAGHAEFLKKVSDHLEDSVVLGEMIRQQNGHLAEAGADFLHP